MAKGKSSAGKSANKKNGDKKRRHAGAPTFAKSKREIVFDPEARKAYLQGFSERKRQRRAYGLAMQKVKDRKAKLEERKQIKKDELQRVEEAERQKAAMMEELLRQQQKETTSSSMIEEESGGDEVDGSDDEERSVDGREEDPEVKQKSILDQKTYDDQVTESHWGGRVTVTTSVVDIGDGDSSDDDSDHDEPDSRMASKKKKSVDHQQQYAGKVEKFMSQLKGNMPGKKKSKDATGHHAKRKGKNGAADMKGIGGAANLKIAQKVLSKAKAKHGGASKDNKKGGKRKSRR